MFVLVTFLEILFFIPFPVAPTIRNIFYSMSNLI